MKTARRRASRRRMRRSLSPESAVSSAPPTFHPIRCYGARRLGWMSHASAFPDASLRFGASSTDPSPTAPIVCGLCRRKRTKPRIAPFCDVATHCYCAKSSIAVRRFGSRHRCAHRPVSAEFRLRSCIDNDFLDSPGSGTSIALARRRIDIAASYRNPYICANLRNLRINRGI